MPEPVRGVQFARLVQRRPLPPIWRRATAPAAAIGIYNRKTGQAERAKTQYEYPQCSACFIQSVEDNMESIMRLAHSEAMLFKFGSGTGTDLSPDPLQQGEAERRRPAQRPALLPQGL